GELGQVLPVGFEVLDRLVGADKDDDQLAPFVAFADRQDLDARRRGGERAVVLQDVGVISELFGLADVVSQRILWRRNARHLGQVIYERADEVRPRGPLLDEACELRVVVLRGEARRPPGDQEQQQRGEKLCSASAPGHDRTPWFV